MDHPLGTAAAFALAALLAPVAPAAPQVAGPAAALATAERALGDGRAREAAIALHGLADGPAAPGRGEAEAALARALEQLGLGFSAFFYDARAVQAGPSHPGFLRGVEGVAAFASAWNDAAIAPSVLAKIDEGALSRLPPPARAEAAAQLALLELRAGRLAEAGRYAALVPEGSEAGGRALYVQGLVAQRKDPERAIRLFRDVLRQPGAGRTHAELRELAHLALGRTLYGLRRYGEAAREYRSLPRFSRHWDEALFEGAYAELQQGEPGAALGRLHDLHSPHLSDEFAPESENLAAIAYLRNCLYPQARAALRRFEQGYLPMRDQVNALLAREPRPLLDLLLLAPGAQGLPAPVQHHLAKNERVDAFLGVLARLRAEEARVRSDPQLLSSTLGPELLERIARQRELVLRVASGFVRGRLVDLAHQLDVLEGQKDTIAFEVTKGEKELLESGVDVRQKLAAQTLERPRMPTSGHEYWPFDGEYWPDEIGYTTYTLKDACLSRKDE